MPKATNAVEEALELHAARFTKTTQSKLRSQHESFVTVVAYGSGDVQAGKTIRRDLPQGAEPVIPPGFSDQQGQIARNLFDCDPESSRLLDRAQLAELLPKYSEWGPEWQSGIVVSLVRPDPRWPKSAPRQCLLVAATRELTEADRRLVDLAFRAHISERNAFLVEQRQPQLTVGTTKPVIAREKRFAQPKRQPGKRIAGAK